MGIYNAGVWFLSYPPQSSLSPPPSTPQAETSLRGSGTLSQDDDDGRCVRFWIALIDVSLRATLHLYANIPIDDPPLDIS